ncbi:MAG TPA: YIP1 family protein [Thermoanaerobaculia bacterium]|nr:YIP1 family protein [Thermoanaerobaculia bacterium]
MSEPATGEPTGPEVSGGRSIVLALTSPREAFEALAAKPVFSFALLALVVLGVAAVTIGFSKIVPEDYLRIIEESGREIPPEMAENPELLMSIARWGTIVGVAVFLPITYFAVAGIYLLALRLAGSDLRYRQSLSVTVHGMLPMAVASVVGIVISLTRDRIDPLELQGGAIVMSNLGFLAEEGTSNAMRAVLTSVDLFSAWCIVLLALGYRIVGRVSAAAAWTTVVVVWIAGVAIKVAMASMG